MRSPSGEDAGVTVVSRPTHAQPDAPGGTADDAGGSALKTVLVFAYECAPHHRRESTIGAQRPAQFAKYLPKSGWRAIVLCCDAKRRGEEAGTAFLDEVQQLLDRSDPRESVIIPTPSLPHDGLVDRAWRSLVRTAGQRSSLAHAFLRKPLTTAKLLTGDHSQAWQPCARAAAARVANARRIDACMGGHSPDAGLFLARWFSRAYGAPWVADFRDPILQPFGSIGRVVYRPVARRLVATASRTINVTPDWAERDGALFGRASVVIPNGFDPEEFRSHEARAEVKRFTIAYAGNIWREMRPGLFLEGLSRLRRMLEASEFEMLRFVYRGAAHCEIARLAERFGVADVTEASPPVPRAEALALMRTADLLLLLSIAPDATRDEYLSRGIYPGKTFEYFGARKPILCVPGDRGVLDELLRRTKTGRCAASAEAVAIHLRDALREHDESGCVRYAPDEAEVGKYSRESTAAQLAQVLNGTVAAGRRNADRPAGATAMARER